MPVLNSRSSFLTDAHGHCLEWKYCWNVLTYFHSWDHERCLLIWMECFSSSPLYCKNHIIMRKCAFRYSYHKFLWAKIIYCWLKIWRDREKIIRQRNLSNFLIPWATSSVRSEKSQVPKNDIFHSKNWGSGTSIFFL